MPIYEYRCDACGHLLDALQKVSDDPLTDCPECSQSALKRLISAPSFRLKGSGWYETDFKSDKERRRNLVESSSPESGDSGDSKKPDKADKAEKSSSKESSKSTESSSNKSSESGPAKSKGSGSEAA